MKHLLFATLIFLLCHLLHLEAQTNNSPDSTNRVVRQSRSSVKREDIRNLMQLTRAEEHVKGIVPQLIKQWQQSFPDVSAAEWRAIEQSIDAKELIELVVPIYSKHLSQTEIRQLIDFYQTPMRNITLPNRNRSELVQVIASKIYGAWMSKCQEQ